MIIFYFSFPYFLGIKNWLNFIYVVIRFYYIVMWCNNIKLKNYLIELLLSERFFLLYFNETSEYLILPFYSIPFNFFLSLIMLKI